ncbi:hypothetical protein [Viridibacillus arvi]|uniref:Uncharacterized protein n=1 Tax=Viridibacillus arvi TaxID=263475 RepID=A0A0M0LL81_9BACL|nr:hypothetical protein [Viridibacillus arvi]KOO51840.1 hypothetical protein AMD00_05235 [Viridibacillus arvi]
MKQTLTIYLNVNEMAHELKQQLLDLLKNDNIHIKKGWENGTHLVLYGFSADELKKVKERLSNILEKYPTKLYDVDNYKKVYSKVNEKFYQNKYDLSNIYQNTIIERNHIPLSNLENINQKKLYLRIDKKLDNLFAEFYFKPKVLLEILELLLDFTLKFDEFWKENYSYSLKLFNPYVSHLSHFTGFVNSLNEMESDIIYNEFEERHDYNGNYIPKRNELFNSFLEIFSMVEEMIINKEINFFSPYKLEVILEGIDNENLALGHAKIYNNPQLINEMNVNTPLIVNKWFLNILYEKLLLMNINVKDKYYLNYSISMTYYGNILRGRLDGVR